MGYTTVHQLRLTLKDLGMQDIKEELTFCNSKVISVKYAVFLRDINNEEYIIRSIFGSCWFGRKNINTKTYDKWIE